MKTLTTGELVSRLHAATMDPVSPGAMDPFTDSPQVRAIYEAFVEAFPDGRFSPLWQVVDGHRAVLGGTMSGTHLGDWLGVAPTGRRVETLATMMYEWADDRVVDIFVVSDSLTMATQMGAVTPVGPKACEVVPTEPPATATRRATSEPARQKWC